MKRTLLLLSSVVVSILLSVALLSTLKSASANDQTVKTASPSKNEELSASLPLSSSEPFELLGQFGGMIDNVAISGTHAYVNINKLLAVLNVENPTAITLVDNTNLLSAKITDVDVHNHHLFVSTNDGFYAFGLSDPSHPKLLSSYAIDGAERETEFLGNFAYSMGGGALSLFDVSNPKSITRKLLIGNTPILRFAITEKRLYANTCYGDRVSAGMKTKSTQNDSPTFGSEYCGIIVYDLTDPGNPTYIGSFSFQYVVYDSLLADAEHLYAANAELAIYSVTNISNVVIESVVQPGNQGLTGSAGISSLAKQDQYLYLAGVWLQIVDISNPKSPKLHNGITLTHSVYDLAVAGDRLFAADGSLQIFDISDPDAPAMMGNFSVYGEDIANSLMTVADEHVYLAGKRLLVVDTFSPTNMSVTGIYTPVGTATNLAISGTVAYLHLNNAAGEKWLRTLDISQPNSPARLGYLLPSAANESEVVGNLLYTVDQQGFHIIDVSQPLTPTLINTIQTAHPATTLEVIGKYAYVGLDDGNMLTVDLVQHQIVASHYFDGEGIPKLEFQQYGTKLIVKTTSKFSLSESNLFVLKLDNPLEPIEVARYCLPDTSAWAVDKGYLFAARGNLLQERSVLEAFNLDDPSQQLPYTSYQGHFSQVAINDNHLFLTEFGQLQLFNWHAPAVPSIPPMQLWVWHQPPTRLVNLPNEMSFWIDPIPSLPLTLTWQIDTLPTQTQVITSVAESFICYRAIGTDVFSLETQNPGLKHITATIENSTGVVSTTSTYFVNSYVPITISQEFGATLNDCNRVVTETCQSYQLLDIPAGAVTKTTQIQFTPHFTLPYPFDNTVLDEAEREWITPISLLPTTESSMPTPFGIEAMNNHESLDELLFITPSRVTRSMWIFEEYNPDTIHLRRWDGNKWVREETKFQVTANGAYYTFDVDIKRTGVYAFFAEIRHTSDWSYLPLITRN